MLEELVELVELDELDELRRLEELVELLGFKTVLSINPLSQREQVMLSEHKRQFLTTERQEG